MTTHGWHAAPQLLARYATEPEALDGVTASSLEEHLLACEHCRRAVAAAADQDAVASSWRGIVDELDRPRTTIAERLLGWFFPDDVARVVAATPALQASWLAAVIAVVALVVWTAHSAGALAPFLAIAPVVPLAGVAASFWPAPDPAGEAALGTPMHGTGLVLRRSVVVLAVSVAVLLAGSTVLPSVEWRSIGWLLPAISLSVAALALSTWVAPLTATLCAGAAWEGLLLVAWIVRRSPQSADLNPMFGAGGQLAFAAMIPIAIAVLVVRQHRLTILEAR